MVYRFQLSRSPRAVLLPVIALILVAGSVALIIFVQPIVGVVALAVSGYISYHLIKFFVSTVTSQIRVFDDQIVFKTSMGAETRFDWDAITVAGWYVSEDGERQLFVYADEDDQLISLPQTYERMEELAAEIGERIKLVELHGEFREDLSDALKELLYPEEVDGSDKEETE